MSAITHPMVAVASSIAAAHRSGIALGVDLAGPAGRHSRRLAGHLRVDGRPRRIGQPGGRVALVQRQQRLERLRIARPSPPTDRPAVRRRAGTVAMVSSSGWIASSSSHANGVDTWAPGRARTDHAPKIVLWGAFWLKSTNTRRPRSSFHHAAVMRSGRRRSSSRATATAADRTS